jgi:hypothetical protein
VEIEPWTIDGELILNCSCQVFCPCVVSLGQHAPTEGYCQTWAGVRIDGGQSGSVDLSGLNVGLLIDIPGNMARGNWSLAAFIDERASDDAYDRLVEIFSGRARGTTGLFSILVSQFLGAERAPVAFETEGARRRLTVGKKIQGEVEPIEGAAGDGGVRIVNTSYWIGPEVIVARATKGRVRAFGRVWDFGGRSAEICSIAWSGP